MQLITRTPAHNFARAAWAYQADAMDSLLLTRMVLYEKESAMREDIASERDTGPPPLWCDARESEPRFDWEDDTNFLPPLLDTAEDEMPTVD